jgi:S-methylmethionine-dependent homocysteine/selenocysteine methylase
MADYQNLKDRIDGGETIILDGAVGTQLQDMGVPMHPVAWCGPANVTHPASVVQMHERYIKAGADVITTNTFSTVRPMLENAGYGDYVREINARAAHNAQEARARAAVDRPVYVAASTSTHIVGRNPRTGHIGIGGAYGRGSGLRQYPESARFTTDEMEDFYTEMTEVMAEAGVDLFLVEPMGRDNEARAIQVKAAKATGLPVWVGFDAYVDANDAVILGSRAKTMDPPAGARVINDDMTLADAVAEISPADPDVMAVFHSRISDTNAGLKVLMSQWSGPAMAYPDAGRADYVQKWQDRETGNEETPDEFTGAASAWVDSGVQVIGACCGFGVEYIEPLRGALPDKIANPRAA